MNEFEKNVQSKNDDVVDSIKGFTVSLLYFLIIFIIGAIISVLN